MALHQGALQIFENNVGVSDAVLLDPLTEDAFIQNLKERFHHDQIYVSTETILHTFTIDQIRRVFEDNLGVTFIISP